MKDKKEKENEKRNISNNKLMEKREKLKELDLENDRQRRTTIKKMQKMEKKKIELDKKKDELYHKIREDINTHMQGAKNNINLLAKEEDERREDILFYENYKFNIALEKDAGNRAKKINSQNKTIENQIETQNKMKEFKKILNTLQEDSITSKTEKERRQIYDEKVKKEREERKKEEEKKLEKLGL